VEASEPRLAESQWVPLPDLPWSRITVSGVVDLIRPSESGIRQVRYLSLPLPNLS
jgi:hypothetical protein